MSALASGSIVVNDDFAIDLFTSLHFDSDSFRTHFSEPSSLMRSLYFMSEDRPLTNVSSEMKENVIHELSKPHYSKLIIESVEDTKATGVSATTPHGLDEIISEGKSAKVGDVKLSAELKQSLLSTVPAKWCSIEMLKLYFESGCMENILALKR